VSAIQPSDPLLGEAVVPTRHESPTAFDPFAHVVPRMPSASSMINPRPSGIFRPIAPAIGSPRLHRESRLEVIRSEPDGTAASSPPVCIFAQLIRMAENLLDGVGNVFENGVIQPQVGMQHPQAALADALRDGASMIDAILLRPQVE
jgi:hypothetical protein